LDIIITLTKKAEQEIRSKELDAAFATLEQAVGIDAQDPFLWHLMARVQLMQGHPDQAEQLAKKSNLLAVDNPSLEKKNGDIIARSRNVHGTPPPN
jgi:predicted Zn-dependent protease